MTDDPDKYRSDKEITREVTGPAGISGYARRVFSSFRNPVFRLYYTSMVGHWGPLQMQMVTRTLLIYRLTDSGSILGLMALAGSVPMLVLSLYGGALADRLDKRRILLIGQTASAVISLGVALTLTLGLLSREVPGSWWILMVSSTLQGIVMGLMMPSRTSIIPELVEPTNLMNAISLNNMGMNLFRILAPAATGFIIAAWDFAAVYYIMTALYILSVVLLYFVRHTPPAEVPRESAVREMVRGLRYIRGNPTIFLVLAFTLSCTVLGMPFNLLLPLFTENIFMVGETGLGILMAVSGVGAIMVSLVLATMPNKRRGMMMLISGLVLSAALFAFAMNTNWGLALVLSAVIGLGQTGQTAVGSTLVQYYVEPVYRGRVMSFIMMGFGISSLGVFFGGVMADTIGIEWSVGGLALGLGALALIMIIFATRLRKLD